MIDNKPKSKVILEEMREKDSNDPIPSRVASTQIEESLIVVGGLSHNLTVSLVWEKSQWVLKRILETTMKPSKIKMPHFGKKQ